MKPFRHTRVESDLGIQDLTWALFAVGADVFGCFQSFLDINERDGHQVWSWGIRFMWVMCLGSWDVERICEVWHWSQCAFQCLRVHLHACVPRHSGRVAATPHGWLPEIMNISSDGIWTWIHGTCLPACQLDSRDPCNHRSPLHQKLTVNLHVSAFDDNLI